MEGRICDRVCGRRGKLQIVPGADIVEDSEREHNGDQDDDADTCPRSPCHTDILVDSQGAFRAKSPETDF